MVAVTGHGCGMKNLDTLAPFALSLIRAGIVALATRLGVDQDPQKLTDISTWVWSLIAAALAAAWSWWSYRKAKNAPPPGVVAMDRADGSKTIVQGDGSTYTLGRAGNLVGLFAAACLLLGGCGMSPSQQYAQASTAYTATLHAVTPLIQAGAVDGATLRRFESVREPVARLLDEWYAALMEGRTFDGTAALDGLLSEFIMLGKSMEAKAHDPGSSRRDGGPAGGDPHVQRPGGDGQGSRRRHTRAHARRDPGRDRRAPGCRGRVQGRARLCPRRGAIVAF